MHRYVQTPMLPAGTKVIDIRLSCQGLPDTKSAPTGTVSSLLSKVRTKKMNDAALSSLKPDSYITMSHNGKKLARTAVAKDMSDPVFDLSFELANDFDGELVFGIMDATSTSASEDKHVQLGTVTLKIDDIKAAANSSEQSLERPIQGVGRADGASLGTFVLKAKNAVSEGFVALNLAAQNLPRLDLTLGIDAYVRLEAMKGAEVAELLYVSEVRSALSPWWSRMKLPLRKLKAQDGITALRVSVLDRDRSGNDDMAGVVTIPVKELLDAQFLDDEIEMDMETKGIVASNKAQKMIRDRTHSKVVLLAVVVRDQDTNQHKSGAQNEAKPVVIATEGSVAA